MTPNGRTTIHHPKALLLQPPLFQHADFHVPFVHFRFDPHKVVLVFLLLVLILPVHPLILLLLL
jgi:hypothetical protein